MARNTTLDLSFRLPCVALAAALALGAGLFGACRTQPALDPEFERWMLAAPFVRLEALDAAQGPAVSLIQALALAREHSPQGTLLEAELGTREGREFCRVRFWEESGLHVLLFDATSGEVALELSAARMQVRRREVDPTEGLRDAPDPESAVRSALREVRGSWARRVWLERAGERWVYRVDLASARPPSAL